MSEPSMLITTLRSVSVLPAALGAFALVQGFFIVLATFVPTVPLWGAFIGPVFSGAAFLGGGVAVAPVRRRTPVALALAALLLVGVGALLAIGLVTAYVRGRELPLYLANCLGLAVGASAGVYGLWKDEQKNAANPDRAPRAASQRLSPAGQS